MKKISFIIIVLCILIVIGCSQNKNYTIEVKDGVEIITNKNIESSPELRLELNLISDISLDELVLPDSIPAMKSFSRTALDHDGNIYISDFRKSVIYKVDKNGNYITNFYRKGQGPGESRVIYDIKVMNDLVYVFGESGKTSIYTRSGDFVEQFRLFDGKYSKIQVMNSDSNIICFCKSMIPNIEEKTQYTTLGMYILDTKNLEYNSKILEINSTEDLNNFKYLINNEQRQCCFSDGRVFLEDLSTTSYAIDVYNLNGKKIRRIKKQTRKIACSDEIKEKAHELDLRNSRVKVIADYMKQILSMYVDKNENLWIKPAVEDLGFDHQYFDIFNSEGVFMKRIKLPLPISFKWFIFDKNKLIARDKENCVIKVFDYELIF